MPSTLSDRLHGCTPPRRAQRGVVLLMALIMMVVISILAVTAVRNAGSAETISGNVRTTELGNQAAEIALRYCEQAVIQSFTGTGSLASLPTIHAYSAAPRWQVIGNWDSPGSPALNFIIPTTSINVNPTAASYQRAPECMVERMPARSGASLSTTSTFVITARGFGPEVAAGSGRPQGSEVWLQSTFELQ